MTGGDSSTYSEPPSDAKKPKDACTLLGQIFTPDWLADLMVRRLGDICPNDEQMVVLDPCVGEGAFPKAFHRNSIEADIHCLDTDPKMVEKTNSWLQNHLPQSRPCFNGDYLLTDVIKMSHNATIANPPYIRHEWIRNRKKYSARIKRDYGERIPGTSNLYAYFIVKIIMELPEDGTFCIVVYDSWMNTKYGQWLVEFLNRRCSSIDVNYINEAPFGEPLIDATVISGRTSTSESQTFQPLILPEKSFFSGTDGFVQLNQEYTTRRGLRLKQASFFMGNDQDIENHGAIRFAKKPACLDGLVTSRDHPESLFLITNDEKLPSVRIMQELQRRLELAQADPENNKSILNWYSERPKHWFRHAKPPAAPILFNYYIRVNPRHILNDANLPFADNYYGVTPNTDTPVEFVFALLNSSAVTLELLTRSRTQGSGLRKLQLFEYREIWVPSASSFNEEQISRLVGLGRNLASANTKDSGIIHEIDSVVFESLGNMDILEPTALRMRIVGILG